MAANDLPNLIPSRRDLLVGGAALLAAGTAYARMPRQPMMMIGKDQLDKIVPLHIDNWSYETASGLVLPPPEPSLGIVLCDLAEPLEDPLAAVLLVDNPLSVAVKLDSFRPGAHSAPPFLLRPGRPR